MGCRRDVVVVVARYISRRSRREEKKRREEVENGNTVGKRKMKREGKYGGKRVSLQGGIRERKTDRSPVGGW